MKQKIISLLICAVMFIASGCLSGDSMNEPDTSLSTTEQTTQDTTASTTDETTSETTTTAVTETSDAATTEVTTTTTSASTTAAQTATEKSSTASQTVKSSENTTIVSDSTLPYPDQMAKLIKAHKYNCSVLVYSMDGETLYSYQPNTTFYGASLIKLPYVYYCCTQISKGVRNLKDTMTYTQSWYHGGSGVIAYSGIGKKYTISQLIDYTLRYSDNVAYDMLVYLFGMDGFNKMVDSWGYNIHIDNKSHFPDVTASFMRTAMQKMQERSGAGGSWSVAWTALNESVNVYSRNAIGGNDKIAIKYGNLDNVWHETCYISGKTPYILVILSGARNYQVDVSFVTGVAKCADKMVKEHYNAKAAAAATTTSASDTTTSPATTTSVSVSTDTAPTKDTKDTTT